MYAIEENDMVAAAANPSLACWRPQILSEMPRLKLRFWAG
jgi:hypothetical protein